jgi:nucleoside-diphosphate-sugar epimerase
MLLVTGGTGFIGSHLLEKLAKSGDRVRALVRRNADLPAGVESVRGDLLTGAGLDEALRGVDCVIHLAGVTKALTAADYLKGNAQASGNLARAAAGRRIRFVHVSSLAAAGPSLDGVPVDEDVPPHPVSDYGRSKLEGERLVRAAVPDAVVVRPPVVYGPRDTGVFQVLKSVSRGWALEIGGGERWFSAIFVRDLVDGIIAAARSSAAPARTYFLSHAKPVSWAQLSAAAARIMGRRLRVLRVPLPVAGTVGVCADLWSRVTRNPGIVSRDKIAEARCMHWTCNPERAASELGFRAATPLDAGLAETLGWYKEAGWLKY